MIELKHISKSFSNKVVLDDFCLKIDNEIVGIMGESGKGKTTIMRIIANLEKADSGEVIVEGDTSISFAEPRLFDNVNVIYNVLLPIKKPNNDDKLQALKILEALGLKDAEDLYPNELSTGMASRVSLARALMCKADNYLLDEPFKALDDDTRDTVISYLKNAFKGKSVLIITHDEYAANMLCDRVIKI